jgi:hypothetical protein
MGATREFSIWRVVSVLNIPTVDLLTDELSSYNWIDFPLVLGFGEHWTNDIMS